MKSARVSTSKQERAIASRSDREKLVIEIRRLRTLFQEIADTYVVRVSAMIQRLADSLENNDILDGESGVNLPLAHYERIVSSIRRLNVKPEKGRRRDLKRIEELAAEIDEIINR